MRKGWGAVLAVGLVASPVRGEDDAPKGVIGIRYILQPEGLIVTNVSSGSGAAQSGMVVGDRILVVEDHKVEDGAKKATTAIRGPVGTRVQLTVAGPLGAEPRTVEPERKRLAPRGRPAKASIHPLVARFSGALRAGKPGPARKAAEELVASDFAGMAPAKAIGRSLLRSARLRPRAANAALDVLREVQREDPAFALKLGEAMFIVGDQEGAAEWLGKADKLRADDAQTPSGPADLGTFHRGREMLANALWDTGERDAAIAIARDLARVDDVHLLVKKVGMADPAPRSSWHAVLPPVDDFETTLFDGSSWRLGDQRGRPVAIVFWASWCGPCKKEMPALAKMWKKRGGDWPVSLLAVSVDVDSAAAKAEKLAKQWDLTFPVARDPGLQEAFDVSGLPSLRVLGAEGSLRYSSRGYSSRSVEELVHKLESLVAERSDGPAEDNGLTIGKAWTAGTASLRGFVAIDAVNGITASDGTVGIGLLGHRPTGLVVQDGQVQGGLELDEDQDMIGAGHVAWLNGPVSGSRGRLWVRASDEDGSERWFTTLPSPLQTLASDGTHVWVAMKHGVVILDGDGAVTRRLDLDLEDLAASPDGGVWGVDGAERVRIVADGTVTRTEAVGAVVVAEDGSWAREGLADLIVGAFGPAGAPRLVGVRSDKTIVGLSGDGEPVLVVELEADEPPGIAATDLDGDGTDELLVSVRQRGVATIELEMP